MTLSPVISRHILPFSLKLLYASLRISVTPGNMLFPEKGAIFAFWHGKMAGGWLLAKKLFPGRKITAVVSLSKDGELLSDTLSRLGFSLIRGSSSRGGDEVKRSMLDALRKETVVVLTPDGPQGPPHQFKYGTIRLASANRYPLIFADINFANAWKLKSWDMFEIPKPFTRTDVRLHSFELPEFGNEEELRRYTSNLSARFAHA
ncbi:MAG: DUF374 domain-containing protein [Chlorobiaceae bacterium]|jgi:lysophospholipid acyltransferase (LPLAT)-like uncharacterized protein|nr:DUF374 domain-containing protein [Chlorobiaceae bacterium]